MSTFSIMVQASHPTANHSLLPAESIIRFSLRFDSNVFPTSEKIVFCTRRESKIRFPDNL